MPGFLARLPNWLLIAVLLGLLYGGYRFWQWRKNTSLQAQSDAWNNLMHFSSPRDNPELGK